MPAEIWAAERWGGFRTLTGPKNAEDELDGGGFPGAFEPAPQLLRRSPGSAPALATEEAGRINIGHPVVDAANGLPN